MKNMNCNSSLISIIMPAYNAEKYIEDSIKSVFAQTYTNWELIVIDDNSSDETLAIAQNLSNTDARIKVVHNDSNRGAAGSRNIGFDMAQGDWIALLDSDDMWLPHKLELQLEKVVETDADIVYSSYRLIDDQSAKVSDYVVPESTSYSSMLHENVIGCSTVMFRREIADEHRFSEESYHEDYAMWLKLLKAGYKAAGCSEVLVEYRVARGSKSYNKLNSAKNRWIIYRKVEKLSLAAACIAFVKYAVRGVVKYKN